MNNNKKIKILSGISAGIAEAIIMQPLDTIKVLKQSNQYTGIYSTIRINGVRSLYKGLTPFVTQMGLKYTMRFGAFEMLRGETNTKFGNFCAGATAGFIESLIITPFELVKTNLQTTNTKNPINSTINIYRHNGIRGLYRGFSTTVLRQSINQASNFTIYNEIRKKIIKEDEKPNLLKVMGAGFISGSIGPILNNPFDVIKTRYMNPKYNDKYKSIISTVHNIIKKEGIRKLYSGLGLRLVRVAGGQSIVFGTVETIMYNYKKKYK